MTEQQQREQAIMRARARALAIPPAAESAGHVLDVVEFRLSTETYGVASRQVMAAITLRDFTPLPRARSLVIGLAEWRGALLSLIDPRQALGLSTAALDDLRQVVIVGDERRHVGILVDAVIGTRAIATDTLQPPSRPGDKRLVLGIAPDALIVLDGAALAHFG